ncbi:hypothetical protein QOT17_024473, partial [Balamuthia mandrillaris]
MECPRCSKVPCDIMRNRIQFQEQQLYCAILQAHNFWDTAPFRVLVKHVKANKKSVVLISDSMTMKDIIKACVAEFNLPEHVVRTAYLQVSIKDEIWSF